jgi:hypothetical protein
MSQTGNLISLHFLAMVVDWLSEIGYMEKNQSLFNTTSNGSKAKKFSDGTLLIIEDIWVSGN